MKVWVVGQHISGGDYQVIWDLTGVFDSEEVAKKACTDRSHFIMGPFDMNDVAPLDRLQPAGFYPNLA